MGVPNELVHQMNDALFKVSEDPATKELLLKMGLRTLPRTSPEDTDRVVRREVEQYGPLLKRVQQAPR